MSLQITTGYGSLAAIGMGISDIATIVSLGKRVGNWLSAASGDRDLLQLLDQDEMDILQRRGLIDILRFNKRWGSEMSLLMIDKPMTYKGEVAEKNLEKFSRFTAIMVSIVAALDAFALPDLVQLTTRKVLLELLRTTEFGEDILASQYSHRIKAWRSSAILRGLITETKRIRKGLLLRNAVVEGLMPRGEVPHMVRFLVWLLAENSDTYITPSSDVAGVATCLFQLGIDILSVEGLGESPLPTPCRLKYCPNAAVLMPGRELVPDAEILARVPCTTVSLESPEESLTKFPMDAETANRCRDAWIEGQKAAKFVACRPLVPDTQFSHDDFKYIFYDIGSKPTRTRQEVHRLASAHAFVVNKEFCCALEQIFQHEAAQILTWLLEQTIESSVTDSQVWNFRMRDLTKINAFTVFQAFLMGYYYGIFLPLVDTSTLQLQTVDGAWGFRSPVFLCNMRTLYLSSNTAQEPGIRMLRREDILSILSALLLSTNKIITRIKRNSYSKDNWCLGVVEKRALLVRSLINPCRTLREICSFVLLDVDVSGIPVNIEGLVRPGIPDYREIEPSDISDQIRELWHAVSNRHEGSTTEDATFHIEADWDGDPETLLLCVRYKGRRIETINPATADMTFLQCLVPPVSHPQEPSNNSLSQEISQAMNWTIPDLLNNRPPPSAPANTPLTPLLMSLAGRPRLRYFAAEVYNSEASVRIATNCVETAMRECLDGAKSKHCRLLFTITGTETGFSPDIDDWISDQVEEKIRRLQVKMMTSRQASTLLGDSD
jgi:hypothetical protein